MNEENLLLLTEASFGLKSGGIEYAVLGIGINVKIPENAFPEEIKNIATQIFDNEAFSSSDVRSKLIAEVLEHFWGYYKHLEQKSFLTAY